MSLPKDAQLELEDIRREFGVAAPRMVLNRARDPSNALHSYFEWNEGAAAERYRLLQASALIRAYVVAYVVVRDDTKPPVRGFISLLQDRHPNAKESGDGIRRHIDDVMSDAGLRANLLETALMELRALKRKYESLVELSGIWDSLNVAEQKRKKPRSRAAEERAGV